MRQHAWLLGLALCTAPACGQQPPPESLDALINRGRLAEALTLARRSHDSLGIGDVLELQGELLAADTVYASLRRAGGAHGRVATARLALLAERRGAHDSAVTLAAEVSDAWYAGHEGWSADELVAAGQVLARFAGGQPDAVRDALKAFDAASAADPASPTGRLEAAELLLAHYNAPDAKSDFGRVLATDSSNVLALVGLANVAAFEGNRSALTRSRAALAINPTNVPALLLLARLHLESEQYDSARVATDRALAADATRLEAWAAEGALAWVQGDSAAFLRATSRALAINPRGADYFAAVAEAAARHRRYAGAVELAARGVALDSNSVPSLVALGTNLLRTQHLSEGRAALERAFALDPFHLWTKNSLDLLDQMATFETERSARFEIVAPADQAKLLAGVLLPLLEEAYDSLAVRYAYRPPTPIRLELFDRHADFSVRTIGLAGLGALGVSFGTTLVMDAPNARPAGEFNLGSTAWHELAHTFTLGRSLHRVPRWFSEGLSVLEERRARAGWGARADPLFVQALAADDLLPIDQLNDGFIRPDRPERLNLSYYQASLVVEFLEHEIGIAGVRKMLDGYGRGESTPALVQTLTGAPSASFDAKFLAWLHER
ncbi:MAG: tetratricopeptide repeat protein, partial [Gemmatimonadota bacterium]